MHASTSADGNGAMEVDPTVSPSPVPPSVRTNGDGQTTVAASTAEEPSESSTGDPPAAGALSGRPSVGGEPTAEEASSSTVDLPSSSDRPVAPQPTQPTSADAPPSTPHQLAPSPSPAPSEPASLVVPKTEPTSVLPSATTSSSSTPVPEPAKSATPAPTPAADDKDQDQLKLSFGLTSSSPSVVRERKAVDAHLADRDDFNPILALISSATDHSELEDARAWYEVLLAVNPTAAPQLLSYCELELSQDNQSQVEALFSRAFAKSNSAGPAFPLAYPPLWTSYLHYIRRQNPLQPVPASSPNLPSPYLASRLTITKAYEFALDHVGLDTLSTPIWKEYLAFIKEGETRTTWEEQGKVAELRKVYTRVLKIPVEDVESIWREYDMFEGQVNKITAKKFLAERSPGYMTARSTLKELRTKRPPSASSFTPPLPHRPTWTESDRALVASWKAYADWELTNPLELEDDDDVQARASYVYRKMVGGECRYFPEIWYIASKYSQGVGKIDEAAGYLRAGVQANPSSFLLTFALAELEESRKEFGKVHALFAGLLGRLQPTLEKTKASITDEIAAAVATVVDAVAPRKAAGNHLITDPSEPDLAELKRAQDEERRAKADEIRTRRDKETDELEKGVALVWIMYMRFARRAEGIKSARSIFQKARKSAFLAWQVYEAAAVTEYHCSKEPSVATRIFELGLKVYGEQIDFVDRYLSFLITINDDQNARVLFEKSVAKFSADVARPLWERWARYEYLFGDIASAQRLDGRFGETFPGDSATKNLARRHAYIGIDEISRVDLGFGSRLLKPVPTGPRVSPESYLAPPPPPPPPVVLAAPPAPPVVAAPTPAAAPSPSKRPLTVEAGPSSITAERMSHEADMVPLGRGRQEVTAERMSMRNQPSAAKRMRPSSPTPVPSVAPSKSRWDKGPAGLPAKVQPAPPPPAPVAAAPPPAPAKPDSSLHWFLSMLPPVRAFDGPVFRTEDLYSMISNSAIVPYYPSGQPARPPAPVEQNGGRGARRGW